MGHKLFGDYFFTTPSIGDHLTNFPIDSTTTSEKDVFGDDILFWDLVKSFVKHKINFHLHPCIKQQHLLPCPTALLEHLRCHHLWLAFFFEGICWRGALVGHSESICLKKDESKG